MRIADVFKALWKRYTTSPLALLMTSLISLLGGGVSTELAYKLTHNLLVTVLTLVVSSVIFACLSFITMLAAAFSEDNKKKNA